MKAKVLGVALVCAGAATIPTSAEIIGPEAHATPAALKPRVAPPKPERAVVAEGYSRTRLQVKFVEGSGVRLRAGRFVALGSADISGVNAVLRRYVGRRVERLFERPERELAREKARIEAKSHRQQADKNLYYRLVLRPDAPTVAILDALNALPIVEIAYTEPLLVRAPVSPSFVDRQDYREAAGVGVDADFAATVPGGTGANVKVIDIELAWNDSHEDLTVASGQLIPNGTPVDPFGGTNRGTNHGTAVLGVIAADENGFGVTGIAHDAAVGMVNAVNEEGTDVADSIDLAHASLDAGDVLLLEIEVAGAHGGCDYVTDVGCVAPEWIPAWYDAIASATADGIVVVEAASNGGEDLGNTAAYGDPFPGGRRDSGAIVVGAAAAPGCTDPPRGRLGFSSYGPRVDLQAYGECVVTTGYGDLQDGPDTNTWYTQGFNGTSSASAIVTGAAAVVSSVAQQQGAPMSPTQIRSLLVGTGTPQAIGGSALDGHIGPLPNLRAALEQGFFPAADAAGPYATFEGTDVTVTAAGSTDPQGATLTFAWDLDNDGAFDDATGVTATFTDVGRDGTRTIAVRATDPAGTSDVDTAIVNVSNAAPTVRVDAIGPTAEGTSTLLSGVVTDAGWLDPLGASVEWGDGSPVESLAGMLESLRPDATFAFAGRHVYGDNGAFTVRVCPFDDDTTGTCVASLLVVTNVPPTAAIDQTGATVVNGIPTLIASIGVPGVFSGRSTDPGSDDLTTSWDWDDGGAAPDATTVWLVNPPLSDPPFSPSLQPRDVTDAQAHAFSDACLYTVTFGSRDDDGGSASDSVQVIVGGDSGEPRNAGYWQTQYRPRPTAFPDSVRLCYLEIVGYMSGAFNEARNAATIAAAFDVLFLGGNDGTAIEQLDRQLLTAWLNFANGGLRYGQLVDTDGNGSADTAFSDVIGTAEAVRLNPSSTATQLDTQKDILERINEERGPR
jgi:serine protease